MKAFLKKSLPSYGGSIPYLQSPPIDFSIEGVLKIQGARSNNRWSEQLNTEDLSNHRPWLRLVELLVERTHWGYVAFCVPCKLLADCILYWKQQVLRRVYDIHRPLNLKAQWCLYIPTAFDVKNLYILLRVFFYMSRIIIRINSNYFPTYH